MKNLIASIKGCLLVFTLLAANIVGQTSGKVELGYVVLDEEGSRAVNQETFNTYEGFALSLTDWTWRHDNGTSIRADLRNITLDNRHLSAGASRPGRYNLSFNHNQYRRTYSADGDRFTRRRSTSGQLKVQPHRRVTLFGGVNYTDKQGQVAYSFDPASVGFTSLTDYTHTRFNIGGELRCPYGFLRTEFRHFDLDDKTAGNVDRAANHFIVTAGGQLPRLDRVSVFGGYSYRDDQTTGNGPDLTTNQLWTALRGRLPHNFQIDYRFAFARTEHSGNSIETDNWQNEITLGRNWPGLGGFKVGYENRIADDLIDRTESNGTDACAACHAALHESFMKTGHPFKLNEAEDAQEDSYYPFTTIPSPPSGIAWDDVDKVIGGFW